MLDSFLISLTACPFSFVPRLGQNNVCVCACTMCKRKEEGDRGQTHIYPTELDNVRSIHMRVHTLDRICSLFIAFMTI